MNVGMKQLLLAVCYWSVSCYIEPLCVFKVFEFFSAHDKRILGSVKTLLPVLRCTWSSGWSLWPVRTNCCTLGKSLREKWRCGRVKSRSSGFSVPLFLVPLSFYLILITIKNIYCVTDHDRVQMWSFLGLFMCKWSVCKLKGCQTVAVR